MAARSTAGVEVEARATAEEDVGADPAPGLRGPTRATDLEPPRKRWWLDLPLEFGCKSDLPPRKRWGGSTAGDKGAHAHH